MLQVIPFLVELETPAAVSNNNMNNENRAAEVLLYLQVFLFLILFLFVSFDVTKVLRELEIAAMQQHKQL